MPFEKIQNIEQRLSAIESTLFALKEEVGDGRLKDIEDDIIKIKVSVKELQVKGEMRDEKIAQFSTLLGENKDFLIELAHILSGFKASYKWFKVAWPTLVLILAFRDQIVSVMKYLFHY